MTSLVKVSLALAVLLVATSTQAQKVRSFTVERTIAAPASDVWQVVGEDFGAIANSHSVIVNSDYIDGSLGGGEGAERVCNMNESGTKYVHERQVNYDPVNYSFTAQIFHVGKLPLDPAHNQAVYQVIPLDHQTSKLVFTMNYRTKPALFGALFKGRFQKTIEDYLLAVDHHVRTGEVVNRDNFKTIKQQYEG